MAVRFEHEQEANTAYTFPDFKPAEKTAVSAVRRFCSHAFPNSNDSSHQHEDS